MEIDENGNYHFDSIEELTYFLNTHEADNGQIYEVESGLNLELNT